MKKFPWMGLVIAALAIGGFALSGHFKKTAPVSAKSSAGSFYYCPMHTTYHSDKPGSCPICHMDLVKFEPESESAPAMEAPKAQAGTPQPKEFTLEQVMQMKPGDICLLHKCKMGNCMIKMTEEIARSGKCPHCGEDLGIIIKEMMPQGYGTVKLSADKQQLIGIKSEPVTKRPLLKTVRAVGTVAKDPELYQAEAEYLQALQAFEKAKAGAVPEITEQAGHLVSSTRIRLSTMGLNDDLIKDLESRKSPDQSLLLPQPGQPVWVYAKVFEYEIPLIKLGQDALVESVSFDNRKLKGKILAVDPTVDPMTRTTRIRIRIEDTQGLLRPDTYVNVSIQVDLGDVLSVIKDAVFDTGTRQIVFVDHGSGKFEPREVKLGSKTEDYVEVKSGLSENEKVVTSGNFLIDSESRLKAALVSIASGEGGDHHAG